MKFQELTDMSDEISIQNKINISKPHHSNEDSDDADSLYQNIEKADEANSAIDHKSRPKSSNKIEKEVRTIDYYFN